MVRTEGWVIPTRTRSERNVGTAATVARRWLRWAERASRGTAKRQGYTTREGVTVQSSTVVARSPIRWTTSMHWTTAVQLAVAAILSPVHVFVSARTCPPHVPIRCAWGLIVRVSHFASWQASGANHDDGLDPRLLLAGNLPLAHDVNILDSLDPSQLRANLEAAPRQFKNSREPHANLAENISLARRQAQENTQACPAGSRVLPDLVPIGLQDRAVVPDSAFAASSFHTHAGEQYHASEARLNNSMWWATAKRQGEPIGTSGEWLQVDLGRPFRVRAIETQGAGALPDVATESLGLDFWTARFTMSWSGDHRCETSTGQFCVAASAWEGFTNWGNPDWSCTCYHRSPFRVHMRTRSCAI